MSLCSFVSRMYVGTPLYEAKVFAQGERMKVEEDCNYVEIFKIKI